MDSELSPTPQWFWLRAKSLANLCNIAYSPGASIRKLLDPMYIYDETNDFINDTNTHTQCFFAYGVVSPNLSLVFLSFRGTEICAIPFLCWRDIWTDMKALIYADWKHSDPQVPKAYVASGFSTAWDAVRDRVRTRLATILSELSSENIVVYITGHSLGGALATLATLDILSQSVSSELIEIYLYTFGCPVLGNKTFMDKIYSPLKKGNFYHIIDFSDPVGCGTYFLTNAITFTGDPYVPPVYKTIYSGGGHSIENYLLAMTAYSSNPPPDSIDPGEGIDDSSFSYPGELLKDGVDTTIDIDINATVTTLVVCTYTGSSYIEKLDPNTDSIDLEVGLAYRTHGVKVALAKSDQTTPFAPNQIDTFDIDLSAINPPLTVADFRKFRIFKSNASTNNAWQLNGVRILVNGKEIYRDIGSYTTLDNGNPDYIGTSNLKYYSIIGSAWAVTSPDSTAPRVDTDVWGIIDHGTKVLWAHGHCWTTEARYGYLYWYLDLVDSLPAAPFVGGQFSIASNGNRPDAWPRKPYTWGDTSGGSTDLADAYCTNPGMYGWLQAYEGTPDKRAKAPRIVGGRFYVPADPVNNRAEVELARWGERSDIEHAIADFYCWAAPERPSGEYTGTVTLYFQPPDAPPTK
jgi:hypothetical protein